MASNPPPASSVKESVHDDLWGTLKQDWHHVRQESAPGWRYLFSRTYAEIEEFYLTPDHRARLATHKNPWRWLILSWWLLKALLLKLTPARRVVLLLALVLLWMSPSVIYIGRVDRIQVDTSPAHFGSLLLIGLLLFELKDKLLAKDELRAGRAVQMALMPEHPPTLAGWDIWLYTQPANDVGGDLVDSLELSPGRLGVALADVAGKALPAALLMAKVQSTLRALATDAPSLGDLAARTNQILCRDGLSNRFATMVYLDVRANEGAIRLLNAGHMPPVHVIAGAGAGPDRDNAGRDGRTGLNEFNGRPHQLPLGNMALGLVPNARYDEQQVDLAAGDMLVVYSDGLTEALDASGDFFGDERLMTLLETIAPLSARDAGRRLLAAVDQFIGDRRPYDDLSLIVLKRLA